MPAAAGCGVVPPPRGSLSRMLESRVCGTLILAIPTAGGKQLLLCWARAADGARAARAHPRAGQARPKLFHVGAV